MNKLGLKLTSIGLVSLLTLTGPVALKSAHAVENTNSPISYNISYIKDEDNVIIDDNYTDDKISMYRNANDNEILELDDSVRILLCNSLQKNINDKITVGDLRSLTTLYFDIETTDLSWLNYCSNLEKLYIRGNAINNLNSVIALDRVKHIILDSNYSNLIELKNLGFLKHCKELEVLSLRGDFKDIEILYTLKNIKNLELCTNYDVDYRRLDFLERLIIGENIYSVAVKFSSDDLTYLEDKGVIVNLGYDNSSLDKFNDINNKLDSIINSFNLSEDATDEKKINTVLIYVLSNLEYDQSVNLLESDQIDFNKYYLDGLLYGVFENNLQICGNYSALISALLHRLGVDSYYIYSKDHAWNLVEVDGEYYYYDSTWLDGSGFSHDKIVNSDDYIFGYKTNPSIMVDTISAFDPSYGESYKPLNFPLSIVEVRNNNQEEVIEGRIEDNNNIGNKLYDITIGNKVFRVTGSILMAIMTSLGVAYVVHKKIKSKNQQEVVDYGFLEPIIPQITVDNYNNSFER